MQNRTEETQTQKKENENGEQQEVEYKVMPTNRHTHMYVI